MGGIAGRFDRFYRAVPGVLVRIAGRDGRDLPHRRDAYAAMRRVERSDLVAGAVLLGIPLLIGAAFLFGGSNEADDAVPARLDELAAECAEFGRCDDRVGRVSSALKNAATAEESYAVGHDARYTKKVADLEREGLQLPAEIELRVVGPARESYCLEATMEGLVGKMHYSSIEGSPSPGPC